MPTALKLESESLLPPFDRSLPATLRQSGELELLRFHSLTRETYSTKSYLSNSPDSVPAVLKTIRVAGGNDLRCEASSPELLRYSAQNGLKLAKDLEADRAACLVERALLDVIEPLPSLLSAVSELAWNCHVILAHDDDYDVSFSDPAIPFSVFISAPARCERNSTLRVAENLIHETMHLQLTLYEGIRPLVDTASSWCMYSPWKQQNRPAQGVLHGLYVFYVLRWMWHELSQTSRNRTDRDFALRRVSEIDQEVSAVRAIEESPALTEAGKHFLRLLFVA